MADIKNYKDLRMQGLLLYTGEVAPGDRTDPANVYDFDLEETKWDDVNTRLDTVILIA